MGQLSHPYMTSGKTIALTIWVSEAKVMFLFINLLLMFVITFLPRNKRLLISWLQSPSAVILELKKLKSLIVSIIYPSICYEVIVPDVMILVFQMLSFQPAFSLSSLTFIKKLFIYLFFILKKIAVYFLLVFIFPKHIFPFHKL